MTLRPSEVARHRVAAIRERNRRVEAHRHLVAPLAYRYSEVSRESCEDLIQVGMLGLIRAAELFDIEQGTPFSAFARPHIRGAILHYLRDTAPMVRLPRRQAEFQDRLSKLERCSQATGSVEDISTATEKGLGVDRSMLETYRDLRQLRHTVPLDHVGIEAICDQRESEPLDDDGSALEAFMACLEPRQRLVVRQVVIEGCSYRQLGRQLNVSPMTVQRLLHRGLSELRRRLEAGDLNPAQAPRPWPCRAASAARGC